MTFASILGVSIFPSALPLICGAFTFRPDDEEDEELFPLILNPTFGTSIFASILPFGALAFASILGTSTFPSTLPLICGAFTSPSDDEEDEEFFPLT